MCVCVYALCVFTCTSESALTGWRGNQVSLPWYFCRSSFFTATLPTNTHEHKKTKLGSKYNSLDASHEADMSGCGLKQTSTRPHMLSILTSISFLKYVSGRCWNTKAHNQWPWNDPVISALKLTMLSSFCPHPPTVKHAWTAMVLQIQISPWEVFRFVVGGHVYNPDTPITIIKTSTQPHTNRDAAFCCSNCGEDKIVTHFTAVLKLLDEVSSLTL